MEEKTLEQLQEEFNVYKATQEAKIQELEAKNRDLTVANETLNNLRLHQVVKKEQTKLSEDIE